MRLLFVLLPAMLTNIKAQDNPISIVATTTIFSDMIENIGGDQVAVISLVGPDIDPHQYELKPSDLTLLDNAAVVMKNGLGLEPWLDDWLFDGEQEVKIVTLSKGVEPIQNLNLYISDDPHAWMSLQNGIIYIQNIRDALSEMLPAHKEMFHFNYGVYRQQMLDLDKDIKQKMASILDKNPVLVSTHDAFRYYSKAYGIRVESVYGISTSIHPTEKDILRLNNILHNANIPEIFYENVLSKSLLDNLKGRFNAEIKSKLFVDALSVEQDSASTYLKVLAYTTSTIVSQFSKVPDQMTKLSNDPSIQRSTENKSLNLIWLWLLAGLVVLIGWYWLKSSKA